VVGDVVTAWILTFPVCGAIGWAVAAVLAKLL
jgi:phosphate/sulfate permease